MIYTPTERREKISGRNAESLLVRKKQNKTNPLFCPDIGCLDWDKTPVNSNTQENINISLPYHTTAGLNFL